MCTYTKKATLSSREVQTAVRLVLPGDLVKHAVSEGTRALTKFTSVNSKSTSRSAQAGLQFPVGRIARYLTKGGFSKRVGGGAPIYMGAVLEYLCAEVLELAGNAAHDNKSSRIEPIHIQLAVRNDKELNKLFGGATIAAGGVLPNKEEKEEHKEEEEEEKEKKKKEEESPFQVNDLVLLHGLTSEAGRKLNGLPATLSACNTSAGTCDCIIVNGDGSIKRIKMSNLKKYAAAEKTTPTLLERIKKCHNPLSLRSLTFDLNYDWNHIQIPMSIRMTFVIGVLLLLGYFSFASVSSPASSDIDRVEHLLSSQNMYLSKSNLLAACDRLKLKENRLTAEVSELCEQLARPLLIPETINVAASSSSPIAPESWCSSAAFYFSTIFSGVASRVYAGVMESMNNIATDFQSEEMKQLLWWSMWFGFPALVLGWFISFIQRKRRKEKKSLEKRIYQRRNEQRGTRRHRCCCCLWK